MKLDLTLKPFTRSDYYGLAGAEPFTNGEAPLLGELELSPGSFLTIVNSQGVIQLLFTDAEGGDAWANWVAPVDRPSPARTKALTAALAVYLAETGDYSTTGFVNAARSVGATGPA